MTLLSTHLKAQSGLLTRKQTGEYLGVTSRTLAIWACTKRYNLPFVKVGRLVNYRITDLDAFIARRTVCSSQSEEP